MNISFSSDILQAFLSQDLRCRTRSNHSLLAGGGARIKALEAFAYHPPRSEYSPDALSTLL